MLNDIKAAADRIRGRVLRTPLRYSRWLSDASGGDVFLKIETIQPTYSYKIRGATNAVMKLVEGTATGEARPIVTASAGNHGRAMAHAAGAAGLTLTVYVAETAPQSKIDAMREAGAELKLCVDYDEAERRAKEHAATGAAIYISPYAHHDVIAGAGTVGLEILEDDPAIDTIVAAMGGGGLISGVAAAAQGKARTIGAEVAASTPFTKSLAAGRIVTIEVGDTIADGLSGNLDPDSPTFDMVRSLVDRVVVVEEHEVIAAMRGIILAERLIIEGATGVAVAAVQTGRVDLRGRRAAVVISGANIDNAQLKAIL
ncbi:MAG: pyridoxal-phosphate dependent enzyme [Vicinamibacterales bacterium]